MRSRQLGILTLASFALFVVLAVAVSFSSGLQDWDLQAAEWANSLALGGLLNSVLVNASLYGREYFWIPVVAVLLIFGDRRTKLVATGLAGVFVAGIAAGEVAKVLVARPRPYTYVSPLLNQYITRIPLDTDFSFPSGHALIVTIGAVYSLLTFRRKWVAALLTVEAAVVCFSRLYTFEHFPTDVLAGVALGAAIAVGGLLVERRWLSSLGERAVNYLIRALRSGPLKV